LFFIFFLSFPTFFVLGHLTNKQDFSRIGRKEVKERKTKEDEGSEMKKERSFLSSTSFFL